MDGNNPRRFCNYFEYNGKKRYTGTVILTRYSYKKLDYKATFVCYDYVTDQYVLEINKKVAFTNPEGFEKDLIAVTNFIDDTAKMPTLRILKDSQIPGLTAGWTWYIVLMLFGVILNCRIMWWAAVSAAFWYLRSGKVKEEGWRIDW